METTWGSELLGEIDAISKHTAAAIDFVDRITNFVKKKCQLEYEYTKDLRKLIKSARSRQVKDDFLAGRGTAILAFNCVIDETENIASEHEAFVDNLQDQVLKPLHSALIELKNTRRLHMNDIGVLKSQLESHYKAVDSSKRNYERACRDSEIATKSLHDAENDGKSTKAQLEKLRNNAASRVRAAEDCRNDYKDKLYKANERKTMHYGSYLPEQLNNMQRYDISRTEDIRKYLSDYIEVHRNDIPLQNNRYENMAISQRSIDAVLDAQVVVEENKSTFVIPENLEFEEYREASAREMKHSIAASFSAVTGFFSKKKRDDDKDFESYPPDKKKRKAMAKVAELEIALEQLNKNRNGALKVYKAYSENPNYGDVNKVKKELIDLAREINRKTVERFNMQVIIAEVDKVSPPEYPDEIPEDSVDCMMGSASVTTFEPTADLKQSDEADVQYEPQKDDSKFRICRALYDFDATGDGELSVRVGRQMYVLVEDTEDAGWTKVQVDEDVGYVPTAYIEYIR